jgi:ubiquinone/menaquinone biosynthesis C-methylase UbiE
MADRRVQIPRKHALIKRYLPEYMEGKKSVLDVSCGAGVFLEVMRYYGNAIQGTGMNMFSMTTAQRVPHRHMDSNLVTYPFGNRSFNLVTCLGAIKQFRNPERALAELFRIARSTVLVKLNSRVHALESRELFSNPPDGWAAKEFHTTVWKYTRQ